MLIYLLRHGLTEYNAQKRYQGPARHPALGGGPEPAAPGRHRPEGGLYHPLQRTAQTARVLFPEAKLVVVKDLQEMCFGSFEGKTTSRWSTTPIIRRGCRPTARANAPTVSGRTTSPNRICNAFSALVDKALADGEELLVILAHGGTQMAAMERYVLPRRDYYEWCGPNAGGYVLDAADWAEKRQLRLVKTVQYTKDAEADA